MEGMAYVEVCRIGSAPTAGSDEARVVSDDAQAVGNGAEQMASSMEQEECFEGSNDCCCGEVVTMPIARMLHVVALTAPEASNKSVILI